MKHLKIRFTSKLEAEYFTSRLDKALLSHDTYDMSETDTIVKVDCLDIRVDSFNGGCLNFTFLRYHDVRTIVASIRFVEDYQIWSI